MSGILERLFAKPVVVTRPPKQVVTKGRASYPGLPRKFKATMSIQPFNERDMMLLPEGERTKQWVKIYSDTLLQATVQNIGQKGDRLPYNGFTYEVQGSMTWDLPGQTRIPHFKSRAVMVQKDQQDVDLT